MTKFAWTITTGAPPAPDPGRARSRYEQIARGADQAGFDAVYIPWTAEGDSPFVVSGLVAHATRQTRIIVETHAGAGSPVYVAKLLASAQRASGGRTDLSLRVRPDGEEFFSAGADLSDEDAEARAEEFVDVFRRVWNETTTMDDTKRSVDVEGRFFHVEGGGLTGILSGVPLPQIYRQPSSSEPRDGVLLVPILVRETEEEAYADRGGEPDFGIVGSYAQAIGTLRAAIADGVSEIIFIAEDPLSELFHVAENVLPALDPGRRERAAA